MKSDQSNQTKPSSKDSEIEEYRKDLEKFIESWIPIDKKDPHYVMEAKLGARIEFVELALEYTQSKLKAFAGEVEKAIGEDEKLKILDTFRDHKVIRNKLRLDMRKALKAIKERWNI